MDKKVPVLYASISKKSGESKKLLRFWAYVDDNRYKVTLGYETLYDGNYFGNAANIFNNIYNGRIKGG